MQNLAKFAKENRGTYEWVKSTTVKASIIGSLANNWVFNIRWSHHLVDFAFFSVVLLCIIKQQVEIRRQSFQVTVAIILNR